MIFHAPLAPFDPTSLTQIDVSESTIAVGLVVSLGLFQLVKKRKKTVGEEFSGLSISAQEKAK